jgi:hypothetical protein
MMAIMRWLSAFRLAIQTILKHACFLDGETWAIYLLSDADSESRVAAIVQADFVRLFWK